MEVDKPQATIETNLLHMPDEILFAIIQLCKNKWNLIIGCRRLCCIYRQRTTVINCLNDVVLRVFPNLKTIKDRTMSETIRHHGNRPPPLTMDPPFLAHLRTLTLHEVGEKETGLIDIHSSQLSSLNISLFQTHKEDKEPIEVCFSKLTALTRLDVGGFEVYGDLLLRLSNLVDLSTNLSPKITTELRSLTKLKYLYTRRWQEVPSSIERLSLHLGLTPPSCNLSVLTNLTSLQLRGINIFDRLVRHQTPEKEEFSENTILRNLTLKISKQTHLDFVQSFVSLRMLSADLKAPLIGISALSKMTTLDTLVFQQTSIHKHEYTAKDIEHVLMTAATLTQLKTMHLRLDSKIQIQHPLQFGTFPNLKSLIVSHPLEGNFPQLAYFLYKGTQPIDLTHFTSLKLLGLMNKVDVDWTKLKDYTRLERLEVSDFSKEMFIQTLFMTTMIDLKCLDQQASKEWDGIKRNLKRYVSMVGTPRETSMKRFVMPKDPS